MVLYRLQSSKKNTLAFLWSYVVFQKVHYGHLLPYGGPCQKDTTLVQKAPCSKQTLIRTTPDSNNTGEAFTKCTLASCGPIQSAVFQKVHSGLPVVLYRLQFSKKHSCFPVVLCSFPKSALWPPFAIWRSMLITLLVLELFPE